MPNQQEREKERDLIGLCIQCDWGIPEFDINYERCRRCGECHNKGDKVPCNVIYRDELNTLLDQAKDRGLQQGKKEAVERLADLREETLGDTFTETPTNETMKQRKEEMLEPLSTPKQDE